MLRYDIYLPAGVTAPYYQHSIQMFCRSPLMAIINAVSIASLVA